MQSYSVVSKYNNLIQLEVTPGHFATSSSHVNNYIDLTSMKSSIKKARAVAQAMVSEIETFKEVDTIICMDGTNVIGAFLARELAKPERFSVNSNKDINVITPSQNSNGQLTFRDNVIPTVRGKNVLLVLSTASTGHTVEKSLECIEYYGGKIAHISALFSGVDTIAGHKINYIFKPSDIEGYASFEPGDCPLCKQNKKIDGIVSVHGLTHV